MNIYVLILFLAIGTAAAGTAHAAKGQQPDRRGDAVAKPDAPVVMADQKSRSLTPRKPLENVLQAIQRILPGRALDARIVDHSGRQAYEIRWMGDNGKVSDITADALSGEIMDKR